MKKLITAACCILCLSSSVWAAKIDLTALSSWSKSAPVPGYKFGGVDETDPGVYMAVWQNSKEEMIGIQIQPAAEFKKLNAVLNHKKPFAFTYSGSPALYIDALAPTASMAVSYEKAGKTLVIVNMGQPRAFSKDEMVKLLDGMNVNKLFQ